MNIEFVTRDFAKCKKSTLKTLLYGSDFRGTYKCAGGSSLDGFHDLHDVGLEYEDNQLFTRSAGEGWLVTP